ncbi:unnamed protein product [Linum trigynum]|uniref:Uncharacterized protein n=1 Tax=Linum trigynum TaxID=586398 RepID=A0AAV2FEH7_9ROSI
MYPVSLSPPAYFRKSSTSVILNGRRVIDSWRVNDWMVKKRVAWERSRSEVRRAVVAFQWQSRALSRSTFDFYRLNMWRICGLVLCYFLLKNEFIFATVLSNFEGVSM